MTKYYTNLTAVLNIFKKPSKKSELISQMIFGESFLILKKNNLWLKIKTKEDNYIGYIHNKNYTMYLNPTHKIKVLKAKVYKFSNKKKKINELPFNSKIKAMEAKNKFLKFSGGWIHRDKLKPINYKDDDLFKRINFFRNIKYKWGGKSFLGIDCSALVQICLNFNNRYCPRDTKDQIRYFKNNITLNKIRKNDIIYWKGHVAVATSCNMLIHAYGPKKKTIKMNIKKTIEIIKKTTNLDVKSIKRI